MSDDAPWHVAADRARQRHDRHVQCGPTGPDRDALASEFQRAQDGRRSTGQHREATRMSDQLPAIIQAGALAVSADTYMVPALIADGGDQAAGAMSNSLPPTSRTTTRAGPMRAPAAGSSPGANNAASRSRPSGRSTWAPG